MGNLERKLSYRWWKYLLVIISSFLVWGIVFDMLASPEKNEKIKITYIGDHLSYEEMEEELFRILPNVTEQKIKYIDAENPVNGQSLDYHTVLSTRVYGADFIIIEESSLEEKVGQTYFKEIATDKLKQHIGDVEFYCEDGVPYGILIYDGTKENHFSEFYSGTEKCYLFITHTSVNFADVVEKGNVTDDAALRIFEYLMEES